MDDVVSAVETFAKEIASDLRTNAVAWMKERIYRINNLDEAKTILEKRMGIVEVPWCGKDKCGHSLEEAVEARLLGFPEDTKEKVDGKCLICGESANNVVRVALAY